MKYYSKKIKMNGEVYDSKLEYERHIMLQMMEINGKIRDLQRQVVYMILPSIYKEVVVHLKTKDKIKLRVDERSKHYTCDFKYWDIDRGCWVVEDVKSAYTAHIRDYPLRRHLVKLALKKRSETEGVEYVFNEYVK